MHADNKIKFLYSADIWVTDAFHCQRCNNILNIGQQKTVANMLLIKPEISRLNRKIIILSKDKIKPDKNFLEPNNWCKYIASVPERSGLLCVVLITEIQTINDKR
jgi:hypothetical protein